MPDVPAAGHVIAAAPEPKKAKIELVRMRSQAAGKASKDDDSPRVEEEEAVGDECDAI